MQGLTSDVRYGIRVLLKSPGFTGAVVLTLALGIGANTAIFSVVNAVLLRPLPFHEPDRLVLVNETAPDGSWGRVSYPNLRDWQDQSHSFSALSAWAGQSVNLTGSGDPERVRGCFVSANLGKVVGVRPWIGRSFSVEEDQPGAQRVAIVSHRLWERRFGGDAPAGHSLTLDGSPFAVIGVMPAGFRFLGEFDVWIPISHRPNFSLDRKTHSLSVVGRLRPDVTLQQAQSEMDGIADRLAEQYPEANRDRGAQVHSLQDRLIAEGGMRPTLMVLLGAVVFILLIACANAANLLLARGMSRQSEMGVRAALGASRMELVRQLLTQALLLSVAGGCLGWALGSWGTRILMLFSPEIPGTGTVELDLRVFAYAAALSLLTGLIFGLVPALQLSKPNLNRVLKGERTSSQDLRRSRMGGALVVTQIAMALVLLAGAGLMIRSVRQLLEVDPGFQRENLLTLEYRLPAGKYAAGRQQWDFHRRVIENVEALPGVRSAAMTRALPFSGNMGWGNFTLMDRPRPAQGEMPGAIFHTSSPGYFETMGIPLLKGRLLDASDRPDSPPAVLINQTMAERFWPDGDPIGMRIRLGDAPAATIVGVVGDVKHRRLEEDRQPQIYSAYAQKPGLFATLVVRTMMEPLRMGEAVRSAVWAVDKDQPVWKLRTVDFLLDRSLAHRQSTMFLLGAFALLALILTVVGLYGLISYFVSMRIREMGIRLALGAQSGDILRLVLRYGVSLTLLGTAVGIVAALGATRFMESMLFEVSATDPGIFIGVSLLLASVAAVACYLPARRAVRMDPTVALRYE